MSPDDVVDVRTSSWLVNATVHSLLYGYIYLGGGVYLRRGGRRALAYRLHETPARSAMHAAYRAKTGRRRA